MLKNQHKLNKIKRYEEIRLLEKEYFRRLRVHNKTHRPIKLFYVSDFLAEFSIPYSTYRAAKIYEESGRVGVPENVKNNGKKYRKSRADRPNHVLLMKLDQYVRGTDNKISVEEVLNKFGATPVCAYSGRPINYEDSQSYSLDHKIPKVNGGESNIDNMQLVKVEVNVMKWKMSEQEFLTLCKEITSRCERFWTKYERRTT